MVLVSTSSPINIPGVLLQYRTDSSNIGLIQNECILWCECFTQSQLPFSSVVLPVRLVRSIRIEIPAPAGVSVHADMYDVTAVFV
jgi:hypothetical protein